MASQLVNQTVVYRIHKQGQLFVKVTMRLTLGKGKIWVLLREIRSCLTGVVVQLSCPVQARIGDVEGSRTMHQAPERLAVTRNNVLDN
jgi:hypothetical protein